MNVKVFWNNIKISVKELINHLNIIEVTNRLIYDYH